MTGKLRFIIAPNRDYVSPSVNKPSVCMCCTYI